MRQFLRAALPVKIGVTLALGITVAVLAAPSVDLPEAAAGGQSRAAAGAANAAAAGDHADELAGGQQAQSAEDVTERLATIQTRLLEQLQLVLDERADEHAAEALQAVIDRLSGENIGLTRAAEAVSGGGAAVDLPTAATTHPSVEDHPTADDHPGRP